jgi:hypothetical protein
MGFNSDVWMEQQGVAMPAMNNLLSRWVPVSERSRSLALVYSGMYLGRISDRAGILPGSDSQVQLALSLFLIWISWSPLVCFVATICKFSALF